MRRYGTYHPDYKKLYPGTEIQTEVLSVLEKSDRKMRYMEVELKRERFEENQERQIARFLPSREDSFDRLREDQHVFFPSAPSAEDTAIRRDELQRLRHALSMLNPEEYALISALYFENFSERAYAEQQGKAYMTIHCRKTKILTKLKKLMESQK